MVRPSELGRSLDSVKRRGGDGTEVRSLGNAALGRQHCWTTAEEAGEEQPLSLPGSDCWIVADARVDNREELRGLLPAGDGSDGAASDAELILAAYLHWGEECGRQLVGDFAFAIWDGGKERLFCARDPLGVRPLFFRRVDGGVEVASSAAGLSSEEGPGEVDRSVLADRLAMRFESSLRQSAIDGVQRLEAGHWLSVKRDGLEVRRYWSFGSQPPTGARSEGEWVELFREQLDLAVAARLRSRGRLGFLVSGGLDSSLVVTSARALLARGGALADDPRGAIYTCSFARTPAADELAFARAVCEPCAPTLAWQTVPGDDLWAFRDRRRSAHEDEPGVIPLAELFIEPIERAAADGCSVVLTGHGGDLISLAHPYHLPRLLRAVPWPALRAELAHFARYSGRSKAQLILLWALLGVIPPALERRLLALRRRWMGRSTGAEAGDRPEERSASGLPATARQCLRQLLDPGIQLVTEEMARLARERGVELRYPLLDRRLIEVALAMPPSLFFRDGVTKRALRLAGRERLPVEVANRVGHAHFGELLDRGMREGIRADVENWLEDARIAEQGLWGKADLEGAWRAYWSGEDSMRSRLAQSVLVESWLRQRSTAR